MALARALSLNSLALCPPSPPGDARLSGTKAFGWWFTASRGRERRVRRAPAVIPTAVLTRDVVFAAGEDLPEDYGSWYPKKDPACTRRAGVILHPSSLRGPHGIGDLGEEALRFLDWLHLSGCTVWQVLPLVPPGRKSNEDGSPYAGQDANCGNTLLISLEELVKDGLLRKDELPEPMDPEFVRFASVADVKDPLIAKAAERLLASKGELKSQLEAYHHDPVVSEWLEDAALFAAIDNDINEISWNEWPEPLKNRHLGALEKMYQKHKNSIDIFIAQQFLFQRQWKKVRSYANKKGIKIIGDMPIYVGYHSADVWANKSAFLLDRTGFPRLVSGVPPDLFSETGQLWGSPLYDWRAMQDKGFSWWIKRIKRACDLYDEFRMDHFRGTAGYWAVPSEAKTAMDGKWKAGPREALFDAIHKAVGKITIIAEDLVRLADLSCFTFHISQEEVFISKVNRSIDFSVQLQFSNDGSHKGVVTEDVVQLRKAIRAPGMAVLQFAFGSRSDNPHLPHNHEPDQVVYTGTHDNDTALGWWENLTDEKVKLHVKTYLGITEEDNIPWALIRCAVASVSQTAIIPIQDILGLGSSARMNVPATQFGNWRWRIPSTVSFDTLKPVAERLRDLLSMYNRL